MVKIKGLLTCFWLITGMVLQAQIPDSELPEYQEKVSGMVNFFQYCLNTVGAAKTSTRDKDVIINESYLKLFRDENVQIEDDLEDREAIINKNVRAYLKDVDFFFKDASFQLDIIKSEALTDENGNPYFKVEVNRKLIAKGIDNEAIADSKQRFIEINVNPVSGDMKIASIYTTKISREQQVIEWWQSLSFGWMNQIQKALGVVGNPTPSELMKMVQMDSLDFSGISEFINLDPLYIFSELQYLNISHTGIYDLKSLRSLSKLVDLRAAQTEVYDLEYLKYHSQLKKLDLSNSRIRDLKEIGKLDQLEELHLEGNYIDTFQVLGNLKNLRHLNLSNTAFDDLGLLTGLKNLEVLDISNSNVHDYSVIGELAGLRTLYLEHTLIVDLSPLAKLTSLQVLNIDVTPVNSLAPLNPLNNIERIYCNNTGISTQEARRFMDQHPQTLVMQNTEALTKWWEKLGDEWKSELQRYLTSERPSMENLVRLVSIDSITVDSKDIQSLEPVAQFAKLRYFSINNNPVSDLQPLSGLEHLEVIKLNGTRVNDLTPLKSNANLKELQVNQTRVTDIFPVTSLKSLQLLEADDCGLVAYQVREFLNERAGCLVIFNSDYYGKWWRDLTKEWQSSLIAFYHLSEVPDTYEIHRFLESAELTITGINTANLRPLAEFLLLKRLEINESMIEDINFVGELADLEELTITKTPLFDLTPIGILSNLKTLNISNTGVDDLRPLSSLDDLRKLNFSGTNVKRLKGVETLRSLESIDCSNTRVFRLDELYGLRQLNLLTCYNSKLSDKDLEGFKGSNPACKIVYY